MAIFGDKFDTELGFSLNDLEQMKQWNQASSTFPQDQILKAGFIGIEPQNDFNFIHRFFAEFFVAKFIISCFFGNNAITSNEHLTKIVKMLVLIESEKNFQIARAFLVSFMKHELHGQKLLPMAMNMLFKEALGCIKKENKLTIRVIQFWSTFLSSETDKVVSFWKLCDLLTKMILEVIARPSDFMELLNMVEVYFGKEWNKVLDKSYEDIGDFNGNFQKLINFIAKNLKPKDQKLVYERLFRLKVLKTIEDCDLIFTFDHVRELFQHDVDFVMKLAKILETSVPNEDFLVYIAYNIEDVLSGDQDLIRTFLFHDYPTVANPLIAALRSGNVKIFQAFKELYLKYKVSMKELQDIVLVHSIIFSHVTFLNDQSFKELEVFLEEIFKDEKVRIAQYITDFFVCGKRIMVRKNAFNFLIQLFKHWLSDKEFHDLKICERISTFNDFIL